MDVGCASIPLPFKRSIHGHLLTIKSNDLQICSVCKLWVSPVLSCATCGFHLGFDCAQLPKLARHKYDDHLLSLDFVKDETCEGDYWCEICEKKIGGKALFYTCNEDYCCSTFHTHCVIGALHLKLKQCFKLFSHEFVVVENSLAALRHCCICGLECKGIEVIMSKGGDKYLCSSSCLMRNRRLLNNL